MMGHCLAVLLSQTLRLRFLPKFEHEDAVGDFAASKFFSEANKSKGDF
jgi:hypothetical protein